jgi:NAD(P) transhydrogenase
MQTVAASTIPLGIHTIPEMTGIGLDESGARERYLDPSDWTSEA